MPTSITVQLRVENIAVPHVIIAVNIILGHSEKDNKATLSLPLKVWCSMLIPIDGVGVSAPR